MNSPWLNLLWKEWREHQWKLLALCSITFALILAARPESIRNWADTLVAIAWVLGAPFGLFIGAGAAAGENNRGTLAFASAQPTSLRSLAAAKLLVGAAVSVLPSLLAVLFFWSLDQWGGLLTSELAGGFRMPPNEEELIVESYFGFFALIAIATALSAFFWTASLAVNSSDEIRAVVWATGFVACWAAAFVTLLAGADYLIGNDPIVQFGAITLWSFGPLGLLAGLMPGGDIPVGWQVVCLALAIAVHAGLAVHFVLRYGRPLLAAHRPPAPSPSPIPAPTYLSAPRTSRLTALAWKEVRESGPLIGVGITVWLLFVVTVVVFWLWDRKSLLDGGGMREFATLIAMPVVYIAPLVAMLMGVGVTQRDLAPSLNTFWRSRPISADAAFWVPVATGMTALLVVFGAPVLLCYLIAGGPLGFEGEMLSLKFIVPAAIMLLLFYASGALFAAATRNAIYAAILSLGAPFTLLVWGAGLFNWMGWTTEMHAIAGVGLLGVIALAAILTAWVLFRTDWPLRGRASR